MVMVDELQSCAPYSPTGQAARVFAAGRKFCHLTTDGELEELHALAASIGLKRAWFQGQHLVPHYDLTEAKREAALAAGAVFVPARKQATQRHEARKADPCWKNHARGCQSCNERPTVGTSGLCGPCYFGEAATVGGRW